MTGRSATAPPPPSPTVHVLDDDPGIRDALSSLFRSVDLAVACWPSAAAFLADAPLASAGCLVVDVRMPGQSGLDFQAQLASLGIQLPIILMTGHGDIPMSVRAMKAGAVDFLTKPFRDQDMLDAVALAIERDATRRRQNAVREGLEARYRTLTAREREVFAHVTAGMMNKQIAGLIGLSEITVKIHRGHAMRKMSAETLADLVRMAETLGIQGSGHRRFVAQ